MKPSSVFLLCTFCLLISKGVSTPIMGGKIVGRLERIENKFVIRNEHTYPFMVYIQLSAIKSNQPTNEQQCGGTLIASQVVLTAAHCIKNIKTDPKIIVTAGVLHLLVDVGQVRQVVKYQVHQNYTALSGSKKTRFQYNVNDIALLWVGQPFILTPCIQLAVLSTKSPGIGIKGDILGWGSFAIGKPSPVLRKAEQKIVDLSYCTREFIDILFDNVKLCLISESKTSSTCHGDSGGPFVVDGVVHGLVSFGKKVCSIENPTAFTNLAHYQNWIMVTVGKWSSVALQELNFGTIKQPPKIQIQTKRPNSIDAPKLSSTIPTKRRKTISS